MPSLEEGGKERQQQGVWRREALAVADTFQLCPEQAVGSADCEESTHSRLVSSSESG